MTRTSLFGLALALFGMGMGVAFVHKGVTFTVWVGIATVGPIGLGALLFDYAELGPFLERALAKWKGAGPGP